MRNIGVRFVFWFAIFLTPSSNGQIPPKAPGIPLKLIFKGAEGVRTGSAVGTPVAKTIVGNACRYEVLLPWHGTKIKGTDSELAGLFSPEFGFVRDLKVKRHPDYRPNEKDIDHDLAILSFAAPCKADPEVPIFTFYEGIPRDGDAAIVLAPDKVVLGTYESDRSGNAFYLNSQELENVLTQGHSGSPVTLGLHRRELIGVLVAIPNRVRGAICVGTNALDWAKDELVEIENGRTIYDPAPNRLTDAEAAEALAGIAAAARAAGLN